MPWTMKEFSLIFNILLSTASQCLILLANWPCDECDNLLTLKSQNPSLSKRHGQVQGDVVLVVAHDTQELKLELKKCLH